MIDILLYSHHLPAWYCIDIVRRNSVLVTFGSERVNWVLRSYFFRPKKVHSFHNWIFFQDVLHNDSLKLDWMFQMSISLDIAKVRTVFGTAVSLMLYQPYHLHILATQFEINSLWLLTKRCTIFLLSTFGHFPPYLITALKWTIQHP